MTQNKIVPAGTIEDIVKRGNSWQEISDKETVEIQKRLEALHALTHTTQKLCLQTIIQLPLYSRSELVPVMILKKNIPHKYFMCRIVVTRIHGYIQSCNEFPYM
jgi:hypothetical protein